MTSKPPDEPSIPQPLSWEHNLEVGSFSLRRIRLIRLIACACLQASVAVLLFGCSDGKISTAPDFTVASADFPQTSLSRKDLLGKLTLIDFWATWCGPCKQAMPDIQKLYDEYRAKGLRVIGISDETQRTVTAFEQSHPFTYPMFIDKSSAAQKVFGVEALPNLFVVDKKGNIVYDDTGAPIDMAALRHVIETNLP